MLCTRDALCACPTGYGSKFRNKKLYDPSGADNTLLSAVSQDWDTCESSCKTTHDCDFATWDGTTCSLYAGWYSGQTSDNGAKSVYIVRSLRFVVSPQPRFTVALCVCWRHRVACRTRAT